MEEIKYIEPAALHDEMLRLRNEKQMDFLESLTGMDWGVADEGDAPNVTRGLGVVYHLESTVTGERIAIKTSTNNRETPEIPSVSDIWKATDFNEREVFDYYGIVFIGHPDMRRLYLRDMKFDGDRLDEIVDLMLETVCTRRKTIRYVWTMKRRMIRPGK